MKDSDRYHIRDRYRESIGKDVYPDGYASGSFRDGYVKWLELIVWKTEGLENAMANLKDLLKEDLND